ncbi:hypothetical protein ACI77M_15340 [Pseudomonas fildesensis]|uniref:hypothetical protein n=1 Tax=Pseudomonas fildesensis TaxID=1674920 RepID=UPI00387B7480
MAATPGLLGPAGAGRDSDGTGDRSRSHSPGRYHRQTAAPGTRGGYRRTAPAGPGHRTGGGRTITHRSRLCPRLEQLLGILTRRGFIIEQTTLAYSAPGDTGLQRLDVDIPLTGPYLLLRETLSDVAKEPAVRIESVTLERKEITSGLLRIGLKVSVLGVVE